MFKRLFRFGGDSNFGKLGNTIITVVGITIIIFEIAYKKDSGVNTGDDRGYVLIPNAYLA